MMLQWYQANKNHARLIEYVDIKCFDMCADADAWAELAEQYHVRLCRNGMNEHVGFWMGYIEPAQTKDDYPRVHVIKLGVIPSARGLGMSRALVRDVRAFAYSIGSHTQVHLNVPESMLTPAWTDCYIGGWLRKMGFVPSQPSLIDMPHSLYGIDFEHAYKFELSNRAFSPHA